MEFKDFLNGKLFQKSKHKCKSKNFSQAYVVDDDHAEMEISKDSSVYSEMNVFPCKVYILLCILLKYRIFWFTNIARLSPAK